MVDIIDIGASSLAGYVVCRSDSQSTALTERIITEGRKQHANETKYRLQSRTARYFSTWAKALC